MRIVNNKIYIIKGETPTYTASVIDKDTGAPLIIDKGLVDDTNVKSLVIEFIVRKSAYSRENDYALKYNLLLGRDVTYHVFDDSKIASYNDLGYEPSVDEETNAIIWNNNAVPKDGDENRLHRYTDNGDNFYCYYDNGAWKDYEFTFNVTFAYRDTSVLEPKVYQYEIALLGGTLKSSPAVGETILNIYYKKPLLGLTDFIVEGSISE